MRLLLFLLASLPSAQPSVPPTALIEGLGMRLYESDAPEPFLGLAVAGEGVWLETGWTDSKVKSRTLYAAPVPDGLTASYLRRDGRLSPLPALGMPLDAPMIFNHEGTTVASTADLAVFLTNDGLGSPGYSYVRDTHGDFTFDVVRRNGERWANGAKNMAAAITPSGSLAVIHSAAEPGGWPNLLASTDRARDFSVPNTGGRSGDRVLNVRLLPVRHEGREVVYAYWIRVGTNRHPLWGRVEVVDGVTRVEVLAKGYQDLFPPEALESLASGGVAGPQPRWLAAFAGGVLMDAGHRGLWYWTPGAGRARLVENVYGHRTRDARYFTASDRVFRLDVDGTVHQLKAIDASTSEPTWTRTATLTFPDASWTDRGAPYVRGTEAGGVWVYGKTQQTHPGTGKNVGDIALAYWAPGKAFPSTP